MGGDTYDHLLPLHKRQCLVTTNLPSLHPFSFHEMIFRQHRSPICDKITSHRRPSDLLGQFTEEEKKMEKFRNFRTGLSRYYWGYF